jgi:hypothetical protein
MGDVEANTKSPQWSEVGRAEAAAAQPDIRKTLDRGRRVEPTAI